MASTLGVIGLVGLWCVAEVPLTTAERGLELARYVDPGVVGGPDAVLYYALSPDRFVLGGVAVLGWVVVAVAVIAGATRFRALVAPG